MSDWDFLHEMRDEGYDAEEIALAAGVGHAPWDEPYISRQWVEEELRGQPPDKPSALEPKQSSKSRDGFPHSVLEQFKIFGDLIDCAKRHYTNTGRYLQVWGELGEIYAEIKFGLRRHGTHHAGSDGTIGDKLVEVKTISPEKRDDRVFVKRAGDFQQLLIVRIDERFEFTGKLFNRDELAGGGGRFLRARMQDKGSLD